MKRNNVKNSKKLVIILIIGFVFRILISTAIYSGDVNNHTQWGESILKYGFSGSYDREYDGVMQPTYPPLSLFSFTTSTGLYYIINDLVVSANKNYPMFPSKLVWAMEDQDVLPAFNKVASILTDLGISVLIYIFVLNLSKRKNLALISSTVYIFNPPVWYLSSLWGQLESFPLFFLLLSIYLLYKKKSIAHLAFVAALLSKQSSIIYIPLFTLISYRQIGLINTIKGFLLQLIVFVGMYLPFSEKFDLLWPIKVYINRIQTGSGSVWITDHAFNPWALLTKLQKIPDSTKVFIGLSASLIGYVLFLTQAGLVMLKTLKNHSFKIYMLAFALLPMISFLSLTKMHERYYAPVLPFLTIASALDPILWVVYIFVSLAHLINVYHEWYFPRISPLDTWVASWDTIELVIATFTISMIFVAVRFFRYKK